MRLYVILNSDLNMSIGKSISQACHAITEVLALDSERGKLYRADGPGTKIILQGNTEQIQEALGNAEWSDLPFYGMVDKPPTTEGTENKLTSAAFGPITKAEAKFLKRFRLYQG